MPASALPAACLFAAAILWGLCIPVMKALVAEQGLLAPELGSLPASLASLAVRFGIAALVLMGAARIAPWRLNRREWGHGAALAAFTAVSMFLQVDGLNYTLASTAGFLIALYSVLVPLFAWAARWRPMTPLLAACCLLVLAGMAVLTGFDPRRVALGRGEWENIGAACLFAGQILWVDRVPSGRTDPLKLTFALLALVTAACGAALCLSPAGPATLIRVHATPRAFALEAALAVFGTTLPFVLTLAEDGWRKAIEEDPHLRRGLNVCDGAVTCKPVADALGLPWRDPASLFLARSRA